MSRRRADSDRTGQAGLRPLRRPRPLVAGDQVAVVAPAGPVPRDRLDAGVAVLESWGLRVTVAPHVLHRHSRFDYLAGSDVDRAADLQRAWTDPDVAALLCARGGYGATRVLERLDWAKLRSVPPKILAGYSDITALLQAVGTRLGLASLHAPMVATTAFGTDPSTQDGLYRALFRPQDRMDVTSSQASVLRSGQARGVTVGGCLSLLAATVGTPFAPPNVAGGILILEDVAEDCYRLDRMLTQLRQSGWLDGVAGVAVGSWNECWPDTGVIQEMLRERLGDLGVPIAVELGFGHGPSTHTVPVGAVAELNARATPPVLSVDGASL
ncbi:LD-carboxypeptidase [Lipingzhangella sp. LS1_29]|uniref:LD-carboxypeptidase n=1 Tax=Lipingzhangella rawalii TaxID=2055835 RepID=A0ABU2H2M4_9ACTN|nr:LD-carboxypeptidase [Lipingzhangella rawalii]MDS1269546.1 LD-carboxypeptidase [Lipingzhangella rawalii]